MKTRLRSGLEHEMGSEGGGDAQAFKAYVLDKMQARTQEKRVYEAMTHALIAFRGPREWLTSLTVVLLVAQVYSEKKQTSDVPFSLLAMVATNMPIARDSHSALLSLLHTLAAADLIERVDEDFVRLSTDGVRYAGQHKHLLRPGDEAVLTRGVAKAADIQPELRILSQQVFSTTT
jgi:hypothetical protein